MNKLTALAIALFAASPAWAVQETAPTPAPAPAPAPPPPCASDAHGQFDFWVGEWEVYPNGSENKAANSKIERLYNGCAVRENWMPLQGTGGGSLNSYDPDDERWHQRWVGSSGETVDFVGGMAGENMVLTGLWRGIGGLGQDALVRMTYTPQEDGSVRQHGEASTDHGLTWKTSFDLIYKPKPASGE